MASPRKSTPANAPPPARKATKPPPPPTHAFLGEPASDVRTPPPRKAGRPERAGRQSPAAASVAVRDMVGVLQVVQGPDRDASLPLEAGRTYSVGRGRDNDMVLRDIVASRRHMILSVAGSEVTVIDQGSGNGTRLNGKKIRETVLVDGDQVEVGNTVMRFTQSSNVSSAPPKPPREGPWMDARTVGAGGEAEQLKREFLEESLRADARPLPPQPPRERAPAVARSDQTDRRVRTVPPDPRGRGTTSMGVSRSTVIVVLLVALAVVLVALSVTVAVLLTRPPHGPVSTNPQPADDATPAQKLAARALQLQVQGRSDEADAALAELKLLSKDEWARARRSVDVVREDIGRRERAEEPARPAPTPPEPEKAAPPPEKAAPPPEKATPPPEKAAPPPERPPPHKANPPPRSNPRQERRPAQRQAQKPARPKRMSVDDATALLQKATELARDDKLREAVRLVKQVREQCDDEDVRRKADGKIDRWQRKLDGG